MQTMRVHALRYDPARGAFEGRVDVTREGRVFRYPCRFEAPEDAPRDRVEAALLAQALRMSDTVRAPSPAPQAGLMARAARWLGALPRPLAAAPAPVPAAVSRTPHPRAQQH